jgi:chromosome segregation ATPase
MNHSDIVQELLHKLSKNELLLQDGGNRRYYNKVNGYRNQLKSMYGGGVEGDKLTTEILQNIDDLIPVSVLEEFVKQATQMKDSLLAREKDLLREINDLQAAGSAGDAQKNQRIQELEQQLLQVQSDMTTLQGTLDEKQKELQKSAEEIESLMRNLQQIKLATQQVREKTINNDPVRNLLARFNAFPSASSASAQSQSLQPASNTPNTPTN